MCASSLMPAHAFTVDTARRIIPNATITGVAKSCTNNGDFSYFVVQGWVEDANSIPKEFSLDIPEPSHGGTDTVLLPDGFSEFVDDMPDVPPPPPHPMLSHPLILHLDSISVLHEGADGTATDGSDRDSYRFNWARGRTDGTADVPPEPHGASMARLGCATARSGRGSSAGRRHADDAGVPGGSLASAVPLLVSPAPSVLLPWPVEMSHTLPPPAAPSAMVPPVVRVAAKCAQDADVPVMPASMPAPDASAMAVVAVGPAAPVPPVDAVVAAVTASSDAAVLPNLADFLQRVAEAVTPGLLQLAKPVQAPLSRAARAHCPVRRSGRLASKQASPDHVMSKAKRLICKKLGVAFEEAALDDATLLARYSASFDKPLTDVQIAALTALVQRGAEKKKKAKASA